jgi:hypothetical protein
MKTLLHLCVMAVVLLTASSRCFAMIEIEHVDKPRAKALGIDVRVTAAGNDSVRVIVEFQAAGQLKSFKRVELAMRDGEKFTVSASLLNEGTQPGHVFVSCYVARAQLDQLTLRVVTESGLERAGYDLRIKDFFEPAKGK